VFCYAIANSLDIAQPGFQLWSDAVATACTHWQVFGDLSAPPNVTRVFHAATDWNRSWVQHMWPGVSAAWNHVRTAYPTEPPFDWVVKLDLDTYVRPSAFWQLFAGHNPAHPIMLSAGDTACWLHQEVLSQGDGWFVAVSREASDRIFAPATSRWPWQAAPPIKETVLRGAEGVHTRHTNVAAGCPVLLSGHGEETDNRGLAIPGVQVVHEGGSTYCTRTHGIRVIAPLDHDGFALLMLSPTEWLGDGDRRMNRTANINLPWLWAAAPACLVTPALWADDRETWTTEFGASTHGRWCFASTPALFHSFKHRDLSDLRALILAGLV
jgi:hypothetical protein